MDKTRDTIDTSAAPTDVLPATEISGQAYPPLRAIAGGLQPYHKQSQQRAQMRRLTALLNTTAALVEAMPKGGCLTVKCYPFGATVVLEITDNGMGMPEGLDPFALFKTTKLGGSGLGLPIVEQIVLAHNGTIDYTSEPGRGTTFKIIFPAAV